MTCSIQYYKPVENPDYIDEEEVDIEFLLTNLYAKVGELKRRIEILEAR